MHEFEIIPHTGGKLFISPSNNEIGFHHRSDHAARIYQLSFSIIDGSVRYIPTGGLGKNNVPNGSVPIYIFSDKEGFFGRVCPSCEKTFRTDAGSEEYHCSYCSHRDHSLAFTTRNQWEYIQAYIQLVVSALQERKDIEIDLDNIIANLTHNKSPLIYTEERLQQLNICKECKTEYDILGAYGFCPYCGEPNIFEVFNDNLKMLIKRANATVAQSEDVYQNLWDEMLKNCVSEFESMSKAIRDQLVKLPAIPQRRKDIEGLNFQRIKDAHLKLKAWFGIDIFTGLSHDNIDFILISFERRHLLTHSLGVVDQKYLDNTIDKSVRLNQKIKVSKEEALRIIETTRNIGKRLYDGFRSIS